MRASIWPGASDERPADEAYQDDRISQLEQQQPPPQQQAPPPQAAPAAGPSIADQLEQIAALHQQGVLSDDEFAAAKAKLLAAGSRAGDAVRTGRED